MSAMQSNTTAQYRNWTDQVESRVWDATEPHTEPGRLGWLPFVFLSQRPKLRTASCDRGINKTNWQHSIPWAAPRCQNQSRLPSHKETQKPLPTFFCKYNANSSMKCPEGSRFVIIGSAGQLARRKPAMGTRSVAPRKTSVAMLCPLA